MSFGPHTLAAKLGQHFGLAREEFFGESSVTPRPTDPKPFAFHSD